MKSNLLLSVSLLTLLAAVAPTAAQAEAPHFEGCFQFGPSNCPPGSGVRIEGDFTFGQAHSCTEEIKAISAQNGHPDVTSIALLRTDRNSNSTFKVTFGDNDSLKSTDLTLDQSCNLL